MVFGKLNVDENPRIASAFGIQTTPTIATIDIFKNGRDIDGFVRLFRYKNPISHDDSGSDTQADRSSRGIYD